jgi:carboxypeptidase family protein
MRLIIRLALFLIVAVAVADAPLLGQRQGGPNPAGRQGGADAGAGGRGGGRAARAGGAQEGRGGRAAGADGAQEGRGRGRGPELRTGTSSIRGRVVNATTGSPVRRAQIQAMLSADQGGGRGEPPRNTTTDNNGAFLFANIPAGRWSVRAAKSGYVDQQFGQRSAFASVDPVSVAEGQTLIADFRLSRGGAFSGRVVDEFGDPIAGATISALRYQVTAQGIRTARSGTSVPSDDTGAYRVYGLPPGQYYISMSDPSARNVLAANFTAELANLQGALANVQAGDAGSLAISVRDAINGSGPNTTSYAPTYYPGTASLADAQRLTLGLGEEQSGINLAIVPVRTARISGRVVGSNGSAIQTTITLANQMGQNFGVNGGRGSAGDGAFTIANIPPGSYTLDAVGPRGGAVPPEVASMPIVINGGEDITGLQITTGSGGRISGSMVSDSSARLPAAKTRITAVPSRGAAPAAIVNESGTFELEGLLGVYTMRFESLPNGYMIKSITANGVDVSDAAIEFRPGDRVSMRVELTDRISQVSGTVRANGSLNGATVIIFPDEPSKWTSTSRFIKTAKLNEGGQFTVRGLPPHPRYLAVAIDFLEPGEAQNPDFLQQAKKATSASFGLAAGDQRILDLPLITR